MPFGVLEIIPTIAVLEGTVVIMRHVLMRHVAISS